ncbi:hypothetical protein JX266_004872 [Neoarthrinium moseri]|nr:hypothetical protein JX266_004872 [Neoarthrinium moseri]
MTQLDELMKNSLATIQDLTRSRSVIGQIRDTLIAHGLWTSATPVSRLFDRMSCGIMLTGLDAAGKTTLLEKYMSQSSGTNIVTAIPLIGLHVEGVRCGSTLFYGMDIGGGRRKFHMKLERRFFQACDAAVMIIDCWDRDRLPEAEEELLRIVLAPEGLKHGAPLLILVNKQRLQRNPHSQPTLHKPISCWEVEHHIGKTLDQWHYKFVETDAITGDGIVDAFKWLQSALKGRAEDALQKETGSPVEEKQQHVSLA